jgi:ubiquinone biosynthesis protein
VGPKAMIRHLRENLPFFTEQLPHMPRLIYEVLQLNKEQQVQRLLNPVCEPDPADERRAWWRGLGSAAFVLMSGLALINTFYAVNLHHFTGMAASIAGVGGLVALLNMKPITRR